MEYRTLRTMTVSHMSVQAVLDSTLKTSSVTPLSVLTDKKQTRVNVSLTEGL